MRQKGDLKIQIDAALSTLENELGAPHEGESDFSRDAREGYRWLRDNIDQILIEWYGDFY